jgi:3-dehydroquinate synthetase
MGKQTSNPASAEPPRARAVPVRAPSREYEVVVGAGVLRELGARLLKLVARPGRTVLVADAGLPAPTVECAERSLADAGFQVSALPLSPSEAHKSLATVSRLLVDMARARLERGEPVVSLGGGIVGDVAGFAAAIYRRGVPVVQCPTTLLAMVDASVGGKTGVNLLVPPEDPSGSALRKNMVGAFHQPHLVLCDVRTLASLPEGDLRAGLAECIKHALIGADWGDPGLLDWTRPNMERVLGRDQAATVELVARNVAIKAAVVAGDEREESPDSRGRMTLNAGHSVGHAIEPLRCQPVCGAGGGHQHEPARLLRHGEAVGLGLVAEAACAEALGAARSGLAGDISQLLSVAGLPIGARGLPPASEVAAAMLHDKKVAGGRLRLAVPTGDGRCRILEDPDQGALLKGIETIRA